MKKTDGSLSQVRIIYVTTIVFLVALSIYTYIQVKETDASATMINHTNRVNQSLQKISFNVAEAETNKHAFLLSGDLSLIKRKDESINKLKAEMLVLDSLIKDNQEQIRNFKKLSEAINRKVMSLQSLTGAGKPMRVNDSLKANITEGLQIMDIIKIDIAQMIRCEEYLLGIRNDKYTWLSFITPIYIIILFLGAIFILFVSYNRINTALQKSQFMQGQFEEEKIFAETILDSSQDYITVLDKELRFINANPAGENFILKFLPHFIGEKYDDIFPDSSSIADMQRALKGETIYYKDFYSSLLDLHFEVRYTPLRNKNEVIGVVSQSRDITEMVKDRNKLKKQNDELDDRNSFVETLLNSSLDMIFVVDREKRFVTANQKAQDVYNLIFAGSLIGKKVTDINPDSHNNHIETVFKNGTNLVIKKYKSEKLDKYFELSYIPLKKKNVVYAIMVISHDITDNIQSHEQILTLNQTYEYAEQIGEFGSYRYNIKKKKIEYSDNMYRLLGCEPNEFPAGADFMKYIHPDDVQYVQEAQAETYKNKQTEKWEYRIIRKDGKMIYIRGIGKVIEDNEHELWLIGTLQDITEEKNQEKSLIKKNQELEKMNKELQLFAHISSHDLQEPLRNIQMFASRIAEKDFHKLTDKGKEHFKRMQNAAYRMQILLEDLLTYNRTNSEEHKLGDINLYSIIEDTKTELKESIDEKVAVIENLENAKTIMVPAQFRQIASNLISNALKFSKPETPPYISIKSEIVKGFELNKTIFTGKEFQLQKNYYHISFTDNGIGFEPKYKEKIFEIFQRLNDKEKYKGTGIGLAIVKKILENCEGFITATSNINEGTTFDIYIPTPN